MSHLSLHLATPMIITRQMSDSELEIEFQQMLLRSTATSEFVTGKIDSEEFIECLDACGVSIDAALRDWSQGCSYMA
jgi:hypothetical protein